MYTERVAGMPAHIFYMFDQNKLVGGGYVFNEKHSNNNNYVDDYLKVKLILEEKYGKPDTDEKEWKGDRLRTTHAIGDSQ